MSRSATLATCLPALLLCAWWPEPAAAQHHHGRAAPAPGALHGPAAGAAPASASARWPSDAALRTGMGRIRDVVAALQHHEHQHMGAAQADAAAALLDEHVAYLVDNCRLDPEPDAALHAIIAELLRASAELRSDPADPEPVAAMRRALEGYPLQFDDPDWRPVSVGHVSP